MAVKEDAKKNKHQRTFEGEVVSSAMDKTITVRVIRRFKHPLVGKVVAQLKKYKAHDEDGLASTGDRVEIVECRPISKTKHMRLARVIEKVAAV